MPTKINTTPESAGGTKITEKELERVAGGIDAGNLCYFARTDNRETREISSLSTGLGMKCQGGCFKLRSNDGGHTNQHQCRCHGHNDACVDMYHAIYPQGTLKCH